MLLYILAFLALNSLLFAPIQAKSQINYKVEAQAIGTTNGVVPFWMRSNQYGSIPMAGASSSYLGSAKRDYIVETDSLKKKKLWDWGMGIEGRVNTNIKNNEFILTEGYLKGQLGPFEVRAGRTKETMGLTGDTLLTSGSFAVSGNAVGIPEVKISINEYYTLPMFGRLFSLKGDFAHGWLGSLKMQPTFYIDKVTNEPVIPLNNNVNTYFHQKSLYGKLGKKDWVLTLFGGFNHQVFWGNEDKIHKDHNLTDVQTFLAATTGRVYHSSKVGNHLGSIDLGLELKLDKVQMLFYRQNLYEVGALYHLANIRDGLNGLQINFKNNKTKFQLKTLLLEVINTKNQAGELWSKPTPSGDENYYNHAVYLEGWTYKSRGLGFPFLSATMDVNKNVSSHYSVPRDYFINNRIQALHLGLKTNYQRWDYITKVSYSRNYGTYGNSPWGHSPGLNKPRYNPTKNIFIPVNQASFYLEGIKTIREGLKLGFVIAYDHGGLLNQTAGGLVKLTKNVSKGN